MTLDIAVKKGKNIQNLEAWAVSRYDNPADIMAHCKKTMDRLRNNHFKKTHKGERRVIVKNVRSKKIIGYVNSNAI